MIFNAMVEAMLISKIILDILIDLGKILFSFLKTLIGGGSFLATHIKESAGGRDAQN